MERKTQKKIKMAKSVSHVSHSTCLADFRRDCGLVRWYLQFRERVWVTVLKVFSVNRSWSFRYGEDFLGGCAILGLCCRARSFSSWQELVFIAVSGPLIAVASLVASLVVEHGLHSCGTQALLPHIMRNLRPGIEPMSPALAGWFLTTWPPGKSWRS